MENQPSSAAEPPILLRVIPSWRELIPVLIIGVIACLTANIPHLVGYLAQTDDLRFAWVSVAPVDQLSYFTKMNQGRLGEWVFHLTYTSQPHEGGPIFLFYLFWGHVSDWLGLPIPLLYHLLRFLSGMMLLITAYLFICRLTNDKQERMFSFFLVAFGGGIGWFMMLIGGYLSTDLTVPESSTFLGLMGAPHIILAQSLMLIIWMMLLAKGGRRGPAIKPLIIGGLAEGLIVIIQPFLAATTLATAGLYALLTWWHKKQIPRELFARVALNTLIALPIAGYTNYVLNDNPVFREWMAQNQLRSPSVIYYLTGYGLLFVMALAGVKHIYKPKRDIERLLLIWLAVTVIGLYAPTDVQRRLSTGLHPLLAFLAGIGVYRVWIPRWAPARPHLLTRPLRFAACLTTPALILLFSAGCATHHAKLTYSKNEGQVFSWLSDHALPDTSVLSSPELGAFIPAFTNQRAVSGHSFETLQAEKTEDDVLRFYSPTITLDEQRQLLADWHVDYVIWGPRERALGQVEGPDDALLTLIIDFGDVRLYRPTQ